MCSRAVFISFGGLNKTTGSIWVLASIFKHHPNQIDVITPENYQQHLELEISSIPSWATRQSRLQIDQIISDCVANTHSRLQARLSTNFIVYPFEAKSTNISYQFGNLNTPAKQISAGAKPYRLLQPLADSYYQQELLKLSEKYPDYPFNEGHPVYNNPLGLKILESGPIPPIRLNYLRKIPHFWLDLLRLGEPWAFEQDWLFTAPTWWRHTFNVPWYYWFSAQEQLEVVRLFKLAGVLPLNFPPLRLVERDLAQPVVSSSFVDGVVF